jgi:tetratricopeptide (TPR) repeat protein
MAKSFINLGVLYWRRGDFERSERVLTKAKDILTNTKDTAFLAQCLIGLALVKTSLEKIDDAIDAYHQAIGIAPENFHLWNNLGKLHLLCHQADKAISAFKQSIYINLDDPVAWNGLANAYYQEGNIDEAILTYKRAIDLMQNSDSNKPDGLTPGMAKRFALQWSSLAALYSRKDQVKEAVAAYLKVIAFDSENYDVWNELGMLYMRSNAYQEAIGSFSKVMELKPEKGEAYLNLARAYTELGMHEESISFYKNSIERLQEQSEKDLASNLMEKAMSIVKEKSTKLISKKENEIEFGISYHDMASWFYCQYKEEQTSLNTKYSIDRGKHTAKRGDGKFPKKQYARRISYKNTRNSQTGGRNMAGIFSLNLTKQLKDLPDNIRATGYKPNKSVTTAYVWNEKGNIHFNNHDFEEAIVSYCKAVEIEPTFGRPYHNLALVYFIKGQFQQAIQNYQKSITLLTEDKEKAIAWNGLGNVYRCVKDYAGARVAYQNASELDKRTGGVYDNTTIFGVSEEYKTAEFWNELGKLFFKAGVYNKAALAFQESIRVEPSSGYAYGYLARALTVQGRYQDAISLYRKSIDLIPNDTEKANIWNRLGDVHRKLNDYENALKSYQNAMDLKNDKFSLLNRTRLSLLSNCGAK